MCSIMEEVRDEGRVEGKVEGKAEEKTETVLRMLQIGGFSLETIAAIALMSLDEVRKIAETQKGCAS